MRISTGWRVYWTRNDKDTKTHIEVGNYTACGIEIPYYDGVDRSAFSTTTCKKCLKKQVSLEGEDSLGLAEKNNLKGYY